jgi:cytochrome b6-f complex iron-sulfur subunit
MTEAVIEQPRPLNRREFLFYIWGASMALALGGAGGVVLWYAFPRFREGEFGGEFTLPISNLPAEGSPPQENPEGRFWLVNSADGVVALYKVCTHLGCLYKWVPSNNRFECPCHGSKYTREGHWIEGPAPRSLDRFVLRALSDDGAVVAETPTGDANVDPEAGEPIAIPPDTTELKVDTGARVEGARHT